ncbi:hypothetical protein [Cellulophaga baltica]|uniref:hypothetical protein n=2 Tax=Cellulophaga baltica TaxID=76594 RepID=UPI000408340F|nr:hypothetical protein [Cellulophaga baltica]MCR1026411.1 hypothetical protein [Cellulophaga baltica]
MAWITSQDQNIFKPILLKKIIRLYPNSINYNIEAVKPNKNLEIQEANDLFFVVNVNDFSVLKAFFLIWFFLTLMIYLITFDLYETLFTLPLLVFVLWEVAFNYLNPVQEIVLDRLNGTITYPKRFFYKTPHTVLFSEVQFFEKLDRFESTDSDRDRSQFLYLKHPSNKKKLNLATINIYDRKNDPFGSRLNEVMSFYIWYMDKNRPLPPGTAFDPYRKNDFDRRRDEGFLAPLYPSSIKTSEANSYQAKVKSDYIKNNNF